MTRAFAPSSTTPACATAPATCTTIFAAAAVGFPVPAPFGALVVAVRESRVAVRVTALGAAPRGTGATADADPVPHDAGDDGDEHEHHDSESRIAAPVARRDPRARAQPVVLADDDAGRGGSARSVAVHRHATEPKDRRAAPAAGDGGLVLPELLLDARVRR